jgi:Ca2+-binding EF-hand superfamily protein
VAVDAACVDKQLCAAVALGGMSDAICGLAASSGRRFLQDNSTAVNNTAVNSTAGDELDDSFDASSESGSGSWSSSSDYMPLCGNDEYVDTQNLTAPCTPLSECLATEYESKTATWYSDRECSPLTQCPPFVQFEVVSATPTSDRKCESMTVCNGEQYEVTEPTQSSDRVCEWRVELVVCLSVCEVMFEQCGNTLPEHKQVATATEFCEFMFHKTQLRVQNSTEAAHSAANPASLSCLHIDTPPQTVIPVESVRLFLDLEEMEIPLTVSDAESPAQLLKLTASAADPYLLKTVSTRWSYADGRFILRLVPAVDTDISACRPSPSIMFCPTQITVCAEDQSGGSHCSSFTAEIRPVQTPPSISMDSSHAALMEDESGIIMFTVVEADIPAELVMITATTQDETLMPNPNLNVLGPFEKPCNTSSWAGSPFCRGLRMQGADDKNGDLEVQIEAFDGLYSETYTLNLHIIPQNDPPTIVTDFYDVVIEEDTKTAWIFLVAMDDGDPVINEVTGRLDKGTIFANISSSDNDKLVPYFASTITGSGHEFFFQIKPPKDEFGLATVIVRISDGQFVDEKYFRLTVLPVNDAPVFTTMADVVTEEDVPALVPLTLYDVDNPMGTLAVSITSSNTVLFTQENLQLLLINDTWHMNILPSQHLFGESVLSVYATDGLLDASLMINVSVISINDPPVISSVESVRNDSEMQLYSFDIADVENRPGDFKIAALVKDADDLISYESCRGPCIYAASSNLVLAPLKSIRFGGNGTERWVSIKPNQVMSGKFEVVVYVDDRHNFSSFKINADIISVTVDVRLTLEADINDFDSAAQEGAVIDIAHAAGVDAENVLILDILPGSIILVVAITVTDKDHGIAVADEIGRLHAFGELKINGIQVTELDLQVVGSSFQQVDWEVINDVWGASAALALCCLLAMCVVARIAVITQPTQTEMINTLKAEIVFENRQKGELNLQADEHAQEIGTNHYLHCDIRHILIWLATMYEAFQLIWVVLEVIGTARFGDVWSAGTVGSVFHEATLDFTGERSLYLFAGIAALYVFLPALYLTWCFLFVVWCGYATFYTMACDYRYMKRILARRLDSSVRVFWACHAACNAQLRFHRDELAAVFLDGIFLFPVLRTCFKVMTCQFDAPVDADYKARTDINRVVDLDLYMSLGSVPKLTEADQPECWSGVHVLWVSLACALLVGFLVVTCRYTSELKGIEGGAMRFSSRIETVRVLLLLFLAAACELLSDRGWLVIGAAVFLFGIMLALTIIYQPALGSRGSNLNTFRIGLLAGLFWFASVGAVYLVLDQHTDGLIKINEMEGDIGKTLAVVFAAGSVPFVVVVALVSRCVHRRKMLRFSRHIRIALAGGITDIATPLQQSSGSKTREFVQSSVDLLLLVLQSKEGDKRASAAISLGEIALSAEGNARVINDHGIQCLTDLFVDSSAGVRAAAVSALNMIATTDEGLLNVASVDVVEDIFALLRAEDDDLVFAPVAGLLCTMMYCEDELIRQECLDALMLMTSLDIASARSTAWTALHQVGKQSNQETAQDEVVVQLLLVVLDNTATVEQRLNAADQLLELANNQAEGAKRLSLDDTKRLLAGILHDTTDIRTIFDKFDEDGAGNIGPDELRGLLDQLDPDMDDELAAEALQELDADGDAEISYGEFKEWWSEQFPGEAIRNNSELLATCTELLTAVAMTHEQRIRSFIVVSTQESLDSDALKREGIEKFKKEIRDAADRMGGAGAFKSVFRMYDTDGSGELDYDEFNVAMRQTAEIPKHKVPDEGLVELFEEIDGDGSGEVDADEFIEFIQRDYVHDPAFATLYLLCAAPELQKDVYRVVNEHMLPNQPQERRVMASVALEELSGNEGCIDRILGDRRALEAFVAAFFKEDNDKVCSALAYVLVNYSTAGDEYLDRLFDAGIFDDLGPVIQGASTNKTDALIIIIGGVIKKHAERASKRIVAIFGGLIEEEAWVGCKTVAVRMLLHFAGQLPQFCVDALTMLMGFVQQTNRPTVQIPAVDAIREIGMIDKCVDIVAEQQINHGLLEQLRVETGLEAARMISRCLCVLTTAARRGVAVDGLSVGAPKRTGLSRFKALAQKVIQHKDMLDYVVSTVLTQLRENDGTPDAKSRFVGHTLQQLVAHTRDGDYTIGRSFLRRLGEDLRMRDLAQTVLDPKKRNYASDALAIIAADSECTRALYKSGTIQDLIANLMPFEFGFERVACRTLARMGFEEVNVCREIVRQLLGALQDTQWAVREGAANSLGELASAVEAGRPRVRAELTQEAGPDSSLGHATLKQAGSRIRPNLRLVSAVGHPGAEDSAVPAPPRPREGEAMVMSVLVELGVAQALLMAVRDREFDVAGTACLAVAQMAVAKEAAVVNVALIGGVPTLAQAMRHVDAGVRASAATALGAIGRQTEGGFRAVQEAFGLGKMVAALGKDKSTKVRIALAGAIGQLATGPGSQATIAPADGGASPELDKAEPPLEIGRDGADALSPEMSLEGSESRAGSTEGSLEGRAEAPQPAKRVQFTLPADGGGDEDDDDDGELSKPVIVVPGTNAAVDALLQRVREDLPLVRSAAVTAVAEVFFGRKTDGWIRELIVEHIGALRYRQGTVLDAAVATFEQATLEMSRPKRLKLEALVDRARRILLAGDNISY